MDLRTWLSAERGRTARLAEAMKIAPGYLSQMADGKRPIPVEEWKTIELATAGEVMRWDLWPSRWHVIWPELTKAKGAPKIKAEA